MFTNAFCPKTLLIYQHRDCHCYYLLACPNMSTPYALANLHIFQYIACLAFAWQNVATGGRFPVFRHALLGLVPIWAVFKSPVGWWVQGATLYIGGYNHPRTGIPFLTNQYFMEWQRDFWHHAMGRKVEYPCVPGHELAGVVKQIGSGSAKLPNQFHTGDGSSPINHEKTMKPIPDVVMLHHPTASSPQ